MQLFHFRPFPSLSLSLSPSVRVSLSLSPSYLFSASFSLSLWPLSSIHSSEHDVVALPVQSDALPLMGSAVCLSYIPVISTACSYQLTKSVITLLIYIREVEEGGACSHCLLRALSVGIGSASFCTPINHDPNIPTFMASTVF